MILAGDVGGTNSRLALFSGTPSKLATVAIEIFPSATHSTFREIVRQSAPRTTNGSTSLFRRRRSRSPRHRAAPESAVARNQRRRTRARFGRSRSPRQRSRSERYGIAALTPDDLFPLNAGDPYASGNRVLISAGTGTRRSRPPAIDNHHQPWACEGGHCDFAPRNETQIALLEYCSNNSITSALSASSPAPASSTSTNFFATPAAPKNPSGSPIASTPATPPPSFRNSP